mgnify:CR=1 FL=1
MNKLGFGSSLKYAELYSKGLEIAKFRTYEIYALKVWQNLKKVEIIVKIA